jgi:hypothetical protein
MTTSDTPKKGTRKALPKPGKKKSFKEASEHVMKKYAAALAKLAK